MKNFLFFWMLLIFVFPLLADSPSQNQESERVLPAPFMDFSTQVPIELSYPNRITFVDNESVRKKESAYLTKMYQAKRFPWLEILGTLGAIIGVAWWIKRKPVLIPQKVDLPPQSSLNLSQAKVSLQEGLYEEFFVELIRATRFSIEERYFLKAPEKTSEEFLEEVKARGILDDPSQKIVEELLVLADHVKFAQYHPTSEECQQALSLTERLIGTPVVLNDSTQRR